jgi:hypothetical protein
VAEDESDEDGGARVHLERARRFRLRRGEGQARRRGGVVRLYMCFGGARDGATPARAPKWRFTRSLSLSRSVALLGLYSHTGSGSRRGGAALEKKRKSVGLDHARAKRY